MVIELRPIYSSQNIATSLSLALSSAAAGLSFGETAHML